jgi:hypothetical protein
MPPNPLTSLTACNAACYRQNFKPTTLVPSNGKERAFSGAGRRFTDDGALEIAPALNHRKIVAKQWNLSRESRPRRSDARTLNKAAQRDSAQVRPEEIRTKMKCSPSRRRRGREIEAWTSYEVSEGADERLLRRITYATRRIGRTRGEQSARSKGGTTLTHTKQRQMRIGQRVTSRAPIDAPLTQRVGNAACSGDRVNSEF